MRLVELIHFRSFVQVKTEGGAKVKAKKTGMYKKWAEQTHKRVSLAGTRNDGTAEESTSLAG